MATLDLRPEWLDTIRQILADNLTEAEVLAYGSRVTGTAHEGSDLDLVVRNLFNPSTPVRNLAEVREDLSQSTVPILIDVLDWAQIPDSFRFEIERTGMVVFSCNVKN